MALRRRSWWARADAWTARRQRRRVLGRLVDELVDLVVLTAYILAAACWVAAFVLLEVW